MKFCDVCGKEMRIGSRHDRCKSVVNLSEFASVNVVLEKEIARIQQELIKSVKHWNIKQGRRKLIEMFPDIASREGLM